MAALSSLRLLAALCPLFLAPLVSAQDALGLANGYVDIKTNTINAKIVRDAQVLASLQVAGEEFDFLPFDYLNRRARNGQYHWGDITYRYREVGVLGWTSGDSAQQRRPVSAQAAPSGDVLAASNLAATLPSSPLNITREWLAVDGDLGLRFTVQNTGKANLELGSLGFPAEFNSIFTDRTAVQMQESCSLSDPYIGKDAGHIRVTPVNPRRGSAKALVVTPLGGTQSGFEAYRNLREGSYEGTWYGSQVFEGFYEWQVLSKAWAENEWRAAQQGPWNEPTSRILKPGEATQVGVRFTVVDNGVRGFDDAIRKTGTPTAVGVPGYVLARDLPGKLFLHSESAVSSFSSEPAGALEVVTTSDGGYKVTAAASPWGRVRLTVKYEDGKSQTIHYFITKPTSETLNDLGEFLFNDAWFTDESDPFNRTPSIMTYDYEKRAIVEQDSRAWVAGLSDEGGTGAYVAAAMKQYLQPKAEEVRKLDQFVNEVVWGQIQLPNYSVRKSIFFYDPAIVNYEYDRTIDWTSWTSWNRQNSYYIDRAYNYVHPAAAYWSLYRVARAYPDLVSQDWSWYLEKAWGTAFRVTDREIWYNDMGLMGETIFGHILQDLFREGETDKAQRLETRMKARAQHWDSQEVPYGSEMAWDSTGQEGVYYWSKYFGLEDSAAQTVESVLGYMPTVPHWGWNGCARRYWDFVYAGKLRRTERQIHHYGSGLNAQVLLDAFRNDPTDSYLLRVGYAGSSAPLSNINQDGFPSVAYHAWPDTQKWDGITGDYGGGFLGMALNGGVYVANDIEVGLVAYGGILRRDGELVTVQPKDAVKRRVYIGPLSLLVEIDAGVVEEFTYEEGSVSLTISQPADGPVAEAVVVWVDSRSSTKWAVVHDGATEARGGWRVTFGGSGVTVKLQST